MASTGSIGQLGAGRLECFRLCRQLVGANLFRRQPHRRVDRGLGGFQHLCPRFLGRHRLDGARRFARLRFSSRGRGLGRGIRLGGIILSRGRGGLGRGVRRGGRVFGRDLGGFDCLRIDRASVPRRGRCSG